MLLPHNYHTHTVRCGHASGADHEFVEAAIQAGMETLGFSDHSPYPFSNGYHSGIRMDCSQLEDYVSSILRLKDEYKDDIRILLGLEAEYYPEFFDAWKKLTEPYPFDYFILGQHFVGNEYEGIYSGRPTMDPAVLSAYVDQTIDAMQTGTFLYLAHPDLLRYMRPRSKHYKSEVKRLCEAAKALHIPLEINLLGIWDKRWYPNTMLWKIAGEVGNDVVIGADAHKPSDVYREAANKKAQQMIHKYNLHWIEKLL